MNPDTRISWEGLAKQESGPDREFLKFLSLDFANSLGKPWGGLGNELAD